MKIQLSRIGCTALLLTAAFAGVSPTQAQPTGLPFRLMTVRGVLWDGGWGPNPGPDDGPIRPLPVDVVPIVVPNCAPLPCPDFALGTNTITLGPDGFFTMPIVIPEEFLAKGSGFALRFLVRTNGGQEFTALSGTLPVTAAPFAAVAQSVVGPIPASSLTGTMPTGMLTGTFSSPVSLSNPGNVFVGDGAGLTNVTATTIGGLVMRPIKSTSAAINTVVARNDHVTLERDGSNGGMLIRYPAGAYRQTIACTALTSTGGQINFYNTLVSPQTASTLSLFNGATNGVQFRCTFGDSYNSGHHTEVNLIREGADFYWVGTAISSHNQ